ncbi:MAG: glycosyltransferase [Lachnospiraceae bacterium]|nr:glycosyltransferase [Lachnospiraceae bacterium]
MDRIAVLIPCYNESQTIGKVVRDWKEMLPEAVVYVYDNNSKDGTDRIAVEAGAVVRYEPLQGKGNVIRRMFREVDAECYLMVDGDDTYPAQAGPSMVTEVLEHQADMVVGDRLSSTYFSENKKVLHHVGNNLTRFFINRIFQTDIKDIMTGLRAFSYRFVKTFPVLSRGFEIETEMTIHAVDKNMVIRNQVIQYRERPEGSESKVNTIPDGCKVLLTILNLYKNYRPFSFFGIISLSELIVAALFFFPVFLEFLETGLVRRFPTLIVCGFVVMGAFLTFTAGTILETLVQKDRQEFEFRLQLVEHFYKRERADN